MNWSNKEEQPDNHGTTSNEWIRIVLIAGLLMGLGILVVKWWRQSEGKSAPLMGSAVLALVGAHAMASREGSAETRRIRVALHSLAKTRAVLTPTELYEALKASGLEWDSPSHMGGELARMGVRSQVRTVEGRRERRWYDLSRFTGPAEAPAA